MAGNEFGFHGSGCLGGARPMESETDLFGNPVAPLPRTSKDDPPTNDMDFIQQVLRTATTEQFLLVGPNELVFRRTTGEYVERVSRAEDRAVHQLIDARWLQVGGNHTVRYDRYTGPARSVLVPRKTRAAASRWAALHRPRTWTTAKGA